MRSKKLLLAFLAVFFLFGCTSNAKKEDTKKDEKKSADVFKKNADTHIEGSLSGGFLDAKTNPNFSYTYAGSDLSIPYYILNDFNKTTTVGIVIFVDGIPQKYVTDDHTTASYMQQWTLKPNEQENMNFRFTPTIGKTGDKVGVFIGTVFKPDFKATEKKPSYGNNGNITFTTPVALSYTASVSNPIPYSSQDLTAGKDYSDPGSSSSDGQFTVMSMDFNLPNKHGMPVYHAKNSIYDISFNMKGGSNTHYKVSAFVDNVPVKINGNDYLSVAMKEGKMLTYDFKLDAHAMPKSSTLFMVAIPDGTDYMQDSASTSQSTSILLANDEK